MVARKNIVDQQDADGSECDFGPSIYKVVEVEDNCIDIVGIWPTVYYVILSFYFAILLEKRRRAFLDLLLEAARNGADMSETDIISQVDTFMFEVEVDETTKMTVDIFLLLYNCWILLFRATIPRLQLSLGFCTAWLRIRLSK